MRTTSAVGILLLAVSLMSCSASTDSEVRHVSKAAVSADVPCVGESVVLMANEMTALNTSCVESVGTVAYYANADVVPIDVRKEMLLALRDDVERCRQGIEVNAKDLPEKPPTSLVALSTGGPGLTCDCDPELGPIDCYEDV